MNKRMMVEEECQRLLQVAANSIDTMGHDPYRTYDWVRGRLDGMSEAFLTIFEFELYRIACYYYRVVENKIRKILG